MRRLPLFLLLVLVGLVLGPFLLTAWLREHRGVDISGTVTRKQEIVWHSTFENDITRSTMVTVSYFAPGRSWSATQTVTLPLERYDEINRGDALRMRYLLERDVPDLPLLHSLYRSGFLPIASVDGRSVFTIWRDLLSESTVRLVCAATALILGLWLWYKLRIPGGMFAIVICAVGALIAASFYEIPHPMSPLHGVVRQGKATVQNEWTITKVFANHNSNTPWILEQPVQYVSLEFVPEGRREAVVTADNIDAGSIPNLKIGQSLAIQYERENPRNVLIAEGTRTFWKRNLRGLAISAVIWIVLGGLAIAIWGGLSRTRPDSGGAATS